MRKVLLFLLFFAPLASFGQQSLKEIRKKSWQTFVYRISAAEAIQYEKWDSIPLNTFNDAPLFNSYPTDSSFKEQLPIGHYVLLSLAGNQIVAELYSRSDLIILPINNKYRLQLDIRKKSGEFIQNATVFVGHKKASFNVASQTFWVTQKRWTEATVIVYSPDDTIISYVSALDELNTEISRQRKINYRSSQIYKILNWLPGKSYSIFHKKRPSNRVGASGFIIFNQPKFKPLDTLKFKGYIVDKKWKQYSKSIEVFIEYAARSQQYKQSLGVLKPVSAGAYVHEFLIADTIPVDISCRLVFRTISGKHILSENFKIEDYVLDEIGTQSFRSEKQTYYRNDSLRFFAEAKDANGLYVMDASARLILTSTSIEKLYRDTLSVADTLFDSEVKLKTESETKFVVPTTRFPQADLSISAKLIFKNSNNELQEKLQTIFYKHTATTITVTQVGDSIRAIYMENGIVKTADGEVEMNDEDAIPVLFPCSIKIDPLAEEYSFSLVDTTSDLYEIYEIAPNYQLSFSRISRKDTLGFSLHNPYKIPVYFTVFNGSNIITSGKQSSDNIEWRKVVSDRRQMYKVRWQYYWAGEEITKEENIGLLFKLLNIQIDSKERIFPGQKESIKISVTDYKGEPAANVNLTAASYNNQFKNDIQVKDPPYLVKYKSKKYIERDGFEKDESESVILAKKYLLGKYKAWIDKFAVDSMQYYKLLFPAQAYYDAVTPINQFIPQVSVIIVQDGVPQEIYLLYINRQLSYYNGVTDKMNNAFQAYPENLQLGIRLKDKFIQIDSLYMQPYYKHDLSFDLNNLPPTASIKQMDNYWTSQEILLLENTMWQMQDDYKNNNAYIWQGMNVIKLSGNKEHIAGPFRPNEEMTFFNPNDFDINFKFEPGYQYRLSNKILRLEKKPIFPRKDVKNYLPTAIATMVLGDTVLVVPLINYLVPEKDKKLDYSGDAFKYFSKTVNNNTGQILYSSHKDSVLTYLLLKNLDSISMPVLVLYGNNKQIENLAPGRYSILLVTNKFNVAFSNDVKVKANETFCIKMDSVKFLVGHPIIDRLFIEEELRRLKLVEKFEKQDTSEVANIPDSAILTIKGGGSVSGVVKALKGGNPIRFVSILIKGSRVGVLSDASGSFVLNNLKPGKYTLVFSLIAYAAKEIEIVIERGGNLRVDILLEVGNLSLQEVVVVGYGMKRKLSMTGAVTRVSGLELSSSLQGRAAGLDITSANGSPGAATSIMIRGASSYAGNSEPIYVVDGIVYSAPPNISPELIESMSVLKASEAVGIYGIRAVNGVIVITTKMKTNRKDFRDYAFWIPNFFTDKNGKAVVEVTYPDNVTGWKTYVVGMDARRRMGKSSVITQSYKPMLAQVNLPLFLIDGDSSYFVSKSINYTADTYSVNTSFLVNDSLLSSRVIKLLPNDANIEEQLVAIKNADTLKVSFGLKSTTGFKDEEERKIPVFKKGTEETVGNFWVLQSDTTVMFNGKAGMSAVTLYAHNNTLDVMLEELEQLRLYPYYCMEQICSKITGLVLEKKIRQQLSQPFNNQQEMDGLLKKIQKAQLYDGGWAWWENGKSNLHITNYVATALLIHRENPLVEANIRNAFLYLQNKLSFSNKNELLASLTTLSNGGHAMNYATWLNKIKFDSLNQHQQWQLVKIRQQQKLSYSGMLDTLMGERIETMLGGVHWGAETYRWYSNEIATTILAFEVLKNEPRYQNVLPNIIQYFLEKRRNGFWRNTVETAGILNAVLPTLLSSQPNFTTPAMLSISGDTSFTITRFPYKLELSDPAFKNLTINKKGGGMVYFTAQQRFFNTDPAAVEANFILHTSFKKNEEVVTVVTTGEKVKMLIKVNVLKDAEYVMLTVPIPAGCIFTNKTNENWRVFKEYQKDKLLLFAETLIEGEHEFEVDLEPRYNGTYILNPAKAELMYYPTIYGRNTGKKITLKK